MGITIYKCIKDPFDTSITFDRFHLDSRFKFRGIIDILLIKYHSVNLTVINEDDLT